MRFWRSPSGHPYLGRVLFHDRDEHGPIDVVEEEDGGLLSLQFGSTARQSTMCVDRPDELTLEYTRCLMSALVLRETPPTRALMLGLGGASMVKFLLRHLPGCRVEVVELRRRVVEVAQRFFALPRSHDRLRIHIADGRRFLLEHTGEPFDLVLVDLHTGEGMAPVVQEEDFLPACRRATAVGGVFSANLWYGFDRALEGRVQGLLEASFERVLALPVPGRSNHIAHGLPDGRLPPAGTLEHLARAWQEQAGLPMPALTRLLIRHNGLEPSDGGRRV